MIVANCMFDFVVKGPSSQDQNLKNLWKKLCQQYLEQGISSSNQVRKLTMSSFCNPKSKQDSFPVMSGVKARHMRYLVPCILEIVREMEKPDDPYSRHRVCVVDNLERMYLAMESCHIHMTSKASQQLLKCTSSCLLHYVCKFVHSFRLFAVVDSAQTPFSLSSGRARQVDESKVSNHIFW